MNTKLTLSLDEGFVKDAKRFAKREQKSLSMIVSESATERMENKRRMEEKLHAFKRSVGVFSIAKEQANKALDEWRYGAFKDKYDLP